MQSIVLKTVLKSGGEYNAEHVLRIRDTLLKNIKSSLKVNFVCYSDINIPEINIRPLENKWNGYWSKLEMFRDIEDSFYIDLDMTINGDITNMVMVDSDFIALRNMNHRIEGIGSALMKWRGDRTDIYKSFIKSPEDFMKVYNFIGTNKWGDQSFIWDCLSGNVEYFQDKFPSSVKKFNQEGGLITVFYGRHRPWKKS